MEISTQLLKEKCKKILDAISNKKGIAVDTVEIKVEEGVIYLAITDREYYLTVPVCDDSPDVLNETFRVVVPAEKFLKLINMTTASKITLKSDGKYLFIKGNGNYKIELAADKDGNVVNLPKITISNVTNEFTIKNSILQSLLKYNAKVFTAGESLGQFPFLYMDNQGALTIMRGACSNSFTLEQPVAVFLTEKLVRLFKLFKSEDVKFTLGFDELPNGILQQKVCFSDGELELYAILTTDSQVVDKFPAAALRGIANTLPPHTVVVSKAELAGALERISLFKSASESTISQVIRLTFEVDGVRVEDYSGDNSELVYYSEPCATLSSQPEGSNTYCALIRADDISLLLNTNEDEFLTLSFGTTTATGKGALYISKANIINIIPEVTRRGNK